MTLRTLRSRIGMLNLQTAALPAKVADPIYGTAEYRRWRGIVIGRAGGRCRDPHCAQPFRAGIRLFADHVVELKDGGAPFDPDNGLARCGACHTRKTVAERARRTAEPPMGAGRPKSLGT